MAKQKDHPVTNYKTPAPVEIDEAAVTSEELPQVNYELMPGVVTVNEAELNELIAQNITMKTELGALVGLFQHFAPLVSGGNALTLAMQIPKLLGNKDIAAQVQAIAPIIEKYTKAP